MSLTEGVTTSPSPAQPNCPALMEFTVHRDALVAELAMVQGVTNAKTTVPMLSHVRLSARGAQLYISATSLKESLRASVTAGVRQAGTALLPSRKLYDYVRLLPAGEITLKSLPNGWLQIQAARSRTKMLWMEATNYPQMPNPDGLTIVMIPADIMRGFLPRISPSMSLEESRYTLSGALFVLAPDRISMVSTDGHRLSRVSHAISLPQVTKEQLAIIPARTVSTLETLLSATKAETIEYAETETTLFFGVGGRLLTASRLSGIFPAYEAVLPKKNTSQAVLNVSETERSIRRVAQFSDERSSSVQLVLNDNRLRISSRSPETGESEDVLEVPYGGESIAAGFNAVYLLDFLTSLDGKGDFRMSFKDGQSAALLTPDGHPFEIEHEYVIMPMRA